MLRLTPQQVDVFNAPLWRILEERVIAFIQSRGTDLKETDGAFLKTASQQLIPRARSYGFQSENQVARYVYLSLKHDYKASGQDVFQTLGVPASPVALLRGEQAGGAEAAAAGQVIDQNFSPSPLSPVLRCAVDMSSPTQQALAAAQTPGPDGKPDPCAPLRLALGKAQQDVADAEARIGVAQARGAAELNSPDAAVANQAKLRIDAAKAAFNAARKTERDAQVALGKCQGALQPPQQ